MSIRVLQIIPTLDRCGAEKQLTLLAAGLPRNQFDVHVCALTRGGPLLDDLQRHKIPTTVIGKSWKFDPAAFWRLRRYIRKLAPDIVHTWIFAANSYGRAAAISAGVKHIVAGERCVDRWKVWHELAIDRCLARRTERIVTNSSGVRDFYAEHGLPARKFVVIPNGIEPFVPPANTTRDELLAELDLPSDARLIGAVGRLWPQKRYKDLIWAAELLRVVRDDTYLLIVGDGPQRWRLERYRDQTQVGDRVRFLGQRDDVPRLLPHLDCFWLGSGYEGQSNAVMEAMSAGVPVVATDIPGNRDLVVPDETGYLVPLGDRAAFARQTIVLLDDTDLARRMGQAGRQRMLAEFSVDKMVQRHAAMYRELMGQ
jgi:glycosyltransferase involved in cell wall biosynthesis